MALTPIFANDILHTGPARPGHATCGSRGRSRHHVAAHGPLSLSPPRRIAPFCLRRYLRCGHGRLRLPAICTLSLAALFIAGAADSISVIIRGSLLQLATPPEMRGRVSAVNSLFIGASNELGEFESGLTAQWWGAVRATVFGGIGALAVAGLWSIFFPSLRHADELTAEALRSSTVPNQA